MIVYTSAQIITCKTNEKAFAALLREVRKSGWVNAKSFTKSRTWYKASREEVASWLECGIWEAVKYARDEITIQTLLWMAEKLALNSYKAAYCRKADKTSEQCDALDVSGEDGATLTMDISTTDEGHGEFENDIFGALLQSLDDREVEIVVSRNNEKTLEEIGKSLNISRERVRQIEDRAREKLAKRFYTLTRA